VGMEMGMAGEDASVRLRLRLRWLRVVDGGRLWMEAAVVGDGRESGEVEGVLHWEGAATPTVCRGCAALQISESA
jgi:hypothetical protein